MPEQVMIPDSGAPIIEKPTPSIQPAGVVVEGAAPTVTPQVPSSTPIEVEGKDHFGFLKQIDWVEAIIVIAAITGIVYAVNYYSTQIKTQNGVIATLNQDIADLQTKVQNLQQQQTSTTKNASGDINRLF
jgi:hypothetical protein